MDGANDVDGSLNTGLVDVSTCRVTTESLGALAALRRSEGAHLSWTCPFTLPPWLSAWWSVFGGDAEPLVLVVRREDMVIGVAPLMVRDGTVRFLGDPDVCDYFDCAVAPGEEPLFFEALMDHLGSEGLSELDLGPVRPRSGVLSYFSHVAPLRGGRCSVRREDVLLEADLPSTWEGFLGGLDAKQRHEIRRKLRRLYEAGHVEFRGIRDVSQLQGPLEAFLGIFRMNRGDKAAFMTDRMASYFRRLALALAEEGLLRLFILELDGRPAASVLCFDHLGTRYLYNSAYDSAYREIGVGLMCKVLSLKEAIDEGLQTYNFLKGGEAYKYRLGGKEVPLSRCSATLRTGAAAAAARAVADRASHGPGRGRDD